MNERLRHVAINSAAIEVRYVNLLPTRGINRIALKVGVDMIQANLGLKVNLT